MERENRGTKRSVTQEAEGERWSIRFRAPRVEAIHDRVKKRPPVLQEDHNVGCERRAPK